MGKVCPSDSAAGQWGTESHAKAEAVATAAWRRGGSREGAGKQAAAAGDGLSRQASSSDGPPVEGGEMSNSEIEL